MTLEKSVFVSLIEEIDDDMIVAYTLGECGERLGIYLDGSWDVGPDVGNEIDPYQRPVVTLVCPGIGNLNRSWYAEGWAYRHPETGLWLRLGSDELIEDGSTEAMIETCIREGDGFQDALREKLEEAFDFMGENP